MSGATFARVKFVNGIVFIACGIFICAGSFAKGWHGSASVMGYVMALALVGLGATRLKGGWPRK